MAESMSDITVFLSILIAASTRCISQTLSHNFVHVSGLLATGKGLKAPVHSPVTLNTDWACKTSCNASQKRVREALAVWAERLFATVWSILWLDRSKLFK